MYAPLYVKIKIVLGSYVNQQKTLRNNPFAVCPHLFFSNTMIVLKTRSWYCFRFNNLMFTPHRHKVGDITGVETPDDFIELMHQKGCDVKVSDPPNFQGNSVTVQVPAKSLYIMFVTKELCKDFVQRWRLHPWGQLPASTCCRWIQPKILWFDPGKGRMFVRCVQEDSKLFF